MTATGRQDARRFDEAIANADWLRSGILEYEPRRLHFLTETLTELIIRRAVKPGDVVVDAGANHGFHTRHLLKAVGATGHVHAFEPNPILAAELEELDEPRLVVHRVAVGSHPGAATLHVPVDDDGWGSLLNDHMADRDATAHTVDVSRIESMLCPGDMPTFAKLDVERSEDAALEGMDALLSSSGPLVVFEDAYDNAAACRLARLGYEVMDLLGRPFDESDHQLVNLLASPGDCVSDWRYWVDRAAIEEVTTRYRARFGRRRFLTVLRGRVSRTAQRERFR